MGNCLLQHWLMLTNLWMNQLRWRCWSRLVSDGGLGATLGLDLLPRQPPTSKIQSKDLRVRRELLYYRV